MNKLILIPTLLLYILPLFAQVPADSAYLQITYLEDFARNIDPPRKQRVDEMVLNIGKFSSEFYSKREERVKHLRDSILASGGNISVIQAIISDIPRSFQYYYVYKNIPFA